jgi:hypothetical protein
MGLWQCFAFKITVEVQFIRKNVTVISHFDVTLATTSPFQKIFTTTQCHLTHNVNRSEEEFKALVKWRGPPGTKQTMSLSASLIPWEWQLLLLRRVKESNDHMLQGEHLYLSIPSTIILSWVRSSCHPFISPIHPLCHHKMDTNTQINSHSKIIRKNWASAKNSNHAAKRWRVEEFFMVLEFWSQFLDCQVHTLLTDIWIHFHYTWWQMRTTQQSTKPSMHQSSAKSYQLLKCFLGYWDYSC